MWCSLCRTDVSVRTTGHAGGLLCARCGHDLLAASRPTDAIRQAREILERWNSSDLFERISRTESLDSLHPRMDAVKKPEVPIQLLGAKLPESASPEKSRTAEVVLPDSGDSIPHAHEVATIEKEDDSASSDTSLPVAAVISDATHEHEPDTALTEIGVEATQEAAHAVKLSDLTHTDVLSVTTVTDAKVTGEGITSELQRVMDWARAHKIDPMSITDDDVSHTDSGADAVVEGSQATDFTQSLPPASAAGGEVADSGKGIIHVDSRDGVAPVEPCASAAVVGSAGASPSQFHNRTQIHPAAGVVIHAESVLSPQIPAETANASELPSAVLPKMILRSPMRRPLLHRRFQLERPATTSSAGSENVNRQLRVDQPGGNNDLPEAAAALQDASIASSVAPETKIVSNSPKPGRRIRIDGPESVDAVTVTDGRRGRTQTLPKHRYIDDAHDSTMRGPHFEITAPRRSNLTSVTGQFLAYLGVLGLTIGTAMVIYGHFGGYSEYTPTGWLVTTVAQMLLFLGVINLVSGGIEQNNDDVSRRINTLGEQLLRIEQVTSDAMKGPKLSPRLYDNPIADVEDTSRETAGVNRE